MARWRNGAGGSDLRGGEVAEGVLLDPDVAEPLRLEPAPEALRGMQGPVVLPEVTKPLPLGGGGIELVDQEAAFGGEDAADLPEGPVRVGKMMEGRQGQHHVERGIREGEALRVADLEADVRAAVATVRHVPRIRFEHDHLPAARGEQGGDDTGASADIKEADLRSGVDRFAQRGEDRTAPPDAEVVLDPQAQGQEAHSSPRGATPMIPETPSRAGLCPLRGRL